MTRRPPPRRPPVGPTALVVDEAAPVPPAHRRPSRWNVGTVRRLAFVLVWLAVALSVLSTFSAWHTAVASQRQAAASAAQAAKVDRRLSALEDYVNGKGAQRDAENQQLNQRINDAVCSVLDQLPAGGRLDRVRATYGCGPGLAAPAAHRTTRRTAPAPTPAALTRAPTAATPTTGSPAAGAPAAPSGPIPSGLPGPLCDLIGLFC